jgi:dipeptidyl-peptidase-4
MDRFAGQWWSDDEKYLAFTRTDESKVEVAKRFEISAEGADIYAQRYPRTGTPNASVRLGVVTISKSRAKPTIRWLTLANTPNIYLARVNWLPDNQTLAVQIQSRDQKRLDLFFYDVKSGKRKLILSETDPHWVNLHHDLRFLRQKKQFIWSSERSGVRQLYLYDWSGKLVHQLTRGSLPIHAVEAVDSSESQVFFTGSTDTPPEQHLFKASLETADVVQISQEEGWHDVTMIAKAPFYVDSYSNPMQPNQVSIRSFTGEKLTYLEENSLDAKHPLTPYVSGFSTPIFGSLKNASGTILYYQLLKPKNFQAGQKYPVIVDVYGGPGHQNVRKAWAGKSSLWHQYMAEQGYVIFSLDNRGSSHRERAFEDAIHNELGRAEVEDQKAGIEFLIASGIADPNRIGIFGWSYGGYMTLMSLLNEPALFSAGVSVAPVTDWSLYDTHYTERFLGTPGENPNGYAKSNVLPNIDRLRGKLLLMHGMADDNVLFTNSTKLLHAIQERILPVELMLYPGGKHGLSGKSRQSHVYETIDNFFARNL